MGKPRFKLESVDQLLTPEECIQWMKLRDMRSLNRLVALGRIPVEQWGSTIRRFWPRRILLMGGAHPNILNGQKVKAA